MSKNIFNPPIIPESSNNPQKHASNLPKAGVLAAMLAVILGIVSWYSNTQLAVVATPVTAPSIAVINVPVVTPKIEPAAVAAALNNPSTPPPPAAEVKQVTKALKAPVASSTPTSSAQKDLANQLRSALSH